MEARPLTVTRGEVIRLTVTVSVVGINTEIHIRNGLLDKDKIDSFYVNIGRIIGNFHFSIVPVGTLGVNIFSYGRGKFLFGGRGEDRTSSAV